jgi:general secretion pathway protein D
VWAPSINSNLAKPNSKANMIKQPANWDPYLTSILGLCLGLALQASAQTRTGGTGGGFGGGFGGGATRSSTSSSTSAGSTARTYPNNTTIGDAYFSIDPETHRVVYIADEATAKYIGQVLTNLDRPKPQVLIKVVFLQVTHTDGSDIGLEGSFGKSIGSAPGTSASLTNYQVLPIFTTNFNANGGVSSVSSVPTIVPTSISSQSLPFLSTSNIFGLPGASSGFGGANGLYQILGTDYTVTLHAIAQAGRVKVLSRPSILARNNQPATITVGQEVPLITSVNFDSLGNSHNAYQYQDVGVILKVTPFITEDGLVEMMVSPQISAIDPTLSIPVQANANGTSTVNAPVIDITSADTVVVTADGLTVVIGGMMQTSKSRTDTKIPLLGDIPLLGNLFKRTQMSDSKTELIIFLTPYIVQSQTELAALSAKERARSDATKGLTEEELNKFLDQLPKAKKAAPGGTSKSGKGALVSPPEGP